MFFSSNDMLLAYPDFGEYLEGAIVSSTYPLFSPSQVWDFPYGGNRRRFMFASELDQGCYNAMLLLLKKSNRVSFSELRQKLLDYGTPDLLGKRSFDHTVPPVWISIVGKHGPWPISVYPDAHGEIKTDPVIQIEGYKLQLMSDVADRSDIPTDGKRLFVVADVGQSLHFRIFDRDGNLLKDTDSNVLTGKAKAVEDLRMQLKPLWPLHVLPNSKIDSVIASVTSIVDLRSPGIEYTSPLTEYKNRATGPDDSRVTLTMPWVVEFIVASLICFLFICCYIQAYPKRRDPAITKPKWNHFHLAVVEFFRPIAEPSHSGRQRRWYISSLFSVMLVSYVLMSWPAVVPLIFGLLSVNSPTKIWVGTRRICVCYAAHPRTALPESRLVGVEVAFAIPTRLKARQLGDSRRVGIPLCDNSAAPRFGPVASVPAFRTSIPLKCRSLAKNGHFDTSGAECLSDLDACIVGTVVLALCEALHVVGINPASMCSSPLILPLGNGIGRPAYHVMHDQYPPLCFR